MRLRWIAAFWTLFALFAAVQTWLAMITHGHSVLRIVFYQLCLWGVWAAMTPAIAWFTGRVPLTPARRRNVLLHVLTGLSATVVHSFAWIALTIVIRPWDAMTVREIGPNLPYAMMARLPLEMMIYFATAGVAQALSLSRRTAELESSLTSARLHALELQIQPHFLFNTLNAVSSLVRARQNSDAVEVIAGLSDLLRYTLDHAGEQRVPLEQEIAMLRRYLSIQQVRFPDRLEVEIDVAADVRRAAVPTLILQPLAENAIRHGISASASAGKVTLTASAIGAMLHIELRNSGRLAPDHVRRIGLTNTVERLRQLYPGTHTFELRQSDTGVLATITIPRSDLP
jgi:LytS/YehU family sensor histidine kinase